MAEAITAQTQAGVLSVRAALPEELDEILGFYYQLIDDLEGKAESPRWEKDVWPSRDMLAKAIDAGTLFVGLLQGAVVGGMILDHERPDGYDTAPWQVKADEGEAMTAHLVAVSTTCQGSGIGSALMTAAAKLCREAGAKALRLDVIEGNRPAARLYEKVGFVHIAAVRLFYEDTGWENFDLYELPL